MAYIYALVDPRTWEPRYVGKADEPERRLLSHLRDDSSTRKARWLGSLARLGLRPIVLVLEHVQPGVDWQGAERRWIASYRAHGLDLTNHTDGGEGLSGASLETRRRLSEIRRMAWADPDQRAHLMAALAHPLRRARISQALTGRPKTAAHVAKLPQNQPGRHLTEVAKANISRGLRGNTNRLGIPHTVETRLLLSQKAMGNPSRKGQVRSQAERAKVSAALKGRPKSAAWKEKIREAQLRSWAIRQGRAIS